MIVVPRLRESIEPFWIDALECSVSVLLAILLGHLLNVGNVSWAAFSGYMVMRGHVLDSLWRGTWRIVGSVAGGLLALPLAARAVSSPLTASASLAAIGLGCLYAALTSRRSYAWLFVGLTFAMVVLDKLEHPSIDIRVFVETRILEVCAGTVACVAVSAFSASTLRRFWPAMRRPVTPGLGWHSHAFLHAGQAAAALALLPWFVGSTALGNLGQGAITIMATMMVPAASLGAETPATLWRRSYHRLLGCGLGAGFAFLVLAVAHALSPERALPVVLLAGTVGGVCLGRRLETSGHAAAYAGTQFVLAVLVALVPDNYVAAQLGPALARLSGILAGLLALLPVLAASFCLARWMRRRSS